MPFAEAHFFPQSATEEISYCPRKEGAFASSLIARPHGRSSPIAAEETLPKPTLLYLVTEDWAFCTHRIGIARAARDAGFRVVVATRVQYHEAQILAEGFELAPLLRLRRKSTNPWKELLSLWEIYHIVKRVRPSVVHLAAMKPVLYGSIACRLARTPGVLAAVTGLGYIFMANSLKARLLRRLLLPLFRFAFSYPGAITMFQNEDDRKTFLKLALVRAEKTVLVPGSGVDTEAFRVKPEPSGDPIVLLGARMLKDKGVVEAVSAARSLKRKGLRFRLLLAGEPDPENPTYIPESDLRAWAEEGVVTWLGHGDDMARLLAEAHIACLPSYREGMPKFLLEAGSCGRPSVTTDVPGCRQLVEDGRTGFVVPAQSVQPLADALERLILDPALRQEMGKAARARIENIFSLTKVNAQILAAYQDLLRGDGARRPGPTAAGRALDS